MVAEVEQVLISKGVSYRHSGKNLLVSCFNPEHPDRNPSMVIDKLTGSAKCWSCGYRLDIFKYYGLVGDITNSKAVILRQKIHRIFASVNGLEIPKGAQPYLREYRDIPAAILAKYGAFTHPDFAGRLVFPLRDARDKITCFIGRAMLPGVTPRYQIFPAEVEVPLFPSTISTINSTVILVEGIFDALNLISKGLECVVSINGTQSFGAYGKGLDPTKVLQLKTAGVRKVLLLMDGDDAGRKAADMLSQLLTRAEFLVETVELGDGEDPGSLDADQVRLLRTYI